MTRLLIIFIIWTIISLIVITFTAVVFRRFHMKKRYRRLDAERERARPLLERLSSGGNLDDPASFRRMPGTLGWSAVEEALFAALNSPAVDRAAVAGYFEVLGYFDGYLSALKSKKEWKQALAADRLGRVGSERAVGPLVEALSFENRDLRNMAAHSLGEIGDPAAVLPLVEMLKKTVVNDDEGSLRIVKSSLIALGGSAVKCLLVEMKSPLWQVRAAVTDILSEIHAPQSAPALRVALHDTEQDVRAKAAKGLGKMTDAASFDSLVELTADPFWVVRLHAVRALGLLGDARAIEPVKALLKDKNWQVRSTAAEALGSLGGSAYSVLLQTYLFSEDKFAREQAADELDRTAAVKKLVVLLLHSAGPAGALKPAAATADMKSKPMRSGYGSIGPTVFKEMAETLVSAGHEKASLALSHFTGGEAAGGLVEASLGALVRFTRDEVQAEEMQRH